MGSASFVLTVKRVSGTTGTNRIQMAQSGSTIYTRMKTSSGWSGWVQLARITDIYDEFEEMASTDGSSFGKNFLGVSTATQHHNYHKRATFTLTSSTLSSFSNIPPALSAKAASATVVGVREVYYRSSTNILVKVTELYPNSGHVYVNWYNGSWLGWKSTNITMKAYSITLTANSNVSPFSTYAETVITNDITAYGTPIAVKIQSKSTNPTVGYFSSGGGALFTAGHMAETITAVVTFLKT